jgi:hypothetical protein
MQDEQPFEDKDVAPASATIELRISDLAQLFDSMDPSPFHQKVLDRNAEEYIVRIMRELPASVPTELIVYRDKPVDLPNEGKVLGDAIREHFTRRAQSTRRQLRQLLNRGWISLAAGVTLLLASVIVGEAVARRLGAGPFATVLRESLVIGGWVAMSRPVEILLFDWWQLRQERRGYERLSRVPVRIVYAGHGSAKTTDSDINGNGVHDDITAIHRKV